MDSLNDILQFFSYGHLPAHLRDKSKLFADLAEEIASDLPNNPERDMCLRKLLEAKDCAVRAVFFKEENRN